MQVNTTLRLAIDFKDASDIKFQRLGIDPGLSRMTKAHDFALVLEFKQDRSLHRFASGRLNVNCHAQIMLRLKVNSAVPFGLNALLRPGELRAKMEGDGNPKHGFMPIVRVIAALVNETGSPKEVNILACPRNIDENMTQEDMKKDNKSDM